MRREICIVGDVCPGSHKGSYGVVFLNNKSITFSLKRKDKVWYGPGGSNLRKGDWVCIEDIRYHGTGNPPMMRAYSARLATEGEIKKAMQEKQKTNNQLVSKK